MDATIFVFGTDLLHEGWDTVLANVQERAGAGGIALAATYHDARDVFPHNPRFHVYRHQGDVAWFAPQRSRYASGLVPQLADAAGGADVLAQLCEAAGRRGLAVDAWTIFLHNSVLATAHPDCATHNVYGDPFLTDLCPANPRVRAYCRELAADLARYPVRSLLAESLHYRPLEHGEHHERYLIHLPAEARTLLGLCFCGHCREAGERAGVRVAALAAAVRAALEPLWRGDIPPGPAAPLLGPDAQAELSAFVGARMATVASLVAEVRNAMAPSGVPLSFIDHAGGMPHVMAGTSADDEVTLSSRKLGIDVAAVAGACDEMCLLGYVDTPERLQALLASYARALPAGTRRRVALRPLLPDCHAAQNLAAKVAAVRASGAPGVAFYHYAMMPLGRLDWIRRSLAGEETP
ncbi:hypothetical protein RAMLITH_10950 [Ramlibacter sp. RBP-2]|uniref:Uncharacterized protein n=1 Tax=Ramlibacter lithotrophicus TaxID=2606681 RepID=A0A7X6I6Q1_9BURK|nr:hypothetical protein [Ramlibacter lithotrophicus]NKE66339.1 hypothetical protein [Ramlibacter lithotrophicus]